MKKKDGATKIGAGAVTISSDTDGTFFQYDWLTGNTDTEGDYEGEFQITLASTKIETYPNKGFIPIEIPEDIT